MPGVAVVQDKPWKGIPNQIVYQKGGWVLHVLRGQIGTDKFRAGIREYYRRYRDGNASTGEFRQVMEEVSVSDLEWFFQQWVYRSGSPVVEGGWTYDATAKKITVELTQTQPGEAYRLPLEIGCLLYTSSTPLALSNSINSRKSLPIRIRVDPGLEFENDRYPLLGSHRKVFLDIRCLGGLKATEMPDQVFHRSILQVSLAARYDCLGSPR